MRVLLLNQFYMPDMAPTGRYMHDLARELVLRGHSVTVWCSRRSYNGGEELFPKTEVVEGVFVQRIRALGFGRNSFIGKLADYATFYGLLARRCMIAGRRNWSRFDVVISLTTPPYIGLLGNLVAWRCKAKSIQWVMDLYPDVMAAHGLTRHRGIRYTLLRLLARRLFRRSDEIWALGPCQREKVLQYLNPKATEKSPQVHSIPLWRQTAENKDRSLDSPESPYEASVQERRDELGWSKDTLGVMYSGNMGLGHRFDTILASVRECARRERSTPPASAVRFAFVGGGKRRTYIEGELSKGDTPNATVHDYVPVNRLEANLRAADLHLISLDPAWKGLIVPSKLMNILAVGRPVLFVGATDSEIACWIREAGCGWVVAPDDVEGFLRALEEAHDPNERNRRGQAGRIFCERFFAPDRNVDQLIGQILSLISNGFEKSSPRAHPLPSPTAAVTSAESGRSR